MTDTERYSGSDSAMARAFGAQVHMARADHGLYLVVGRGRSPFVVVRSAGGEPLVQFPKSFALLALMRFETFLALRGHPQLQHIGQITLDPARFEQFAAAAGLDLAPDPTEQSP
jgi:hypothetical protein